MILCFRYFIAVIVLQLLRISSADTAKEAIDNVIEDEITQKLSTDLLQSIEKKFQVDLEKSVDMVLQKIKLLLQNGTTHLQEKMTTLQGMLANMKSYGEKELNDCLLKRQNETTALAEKALHQMVVCGYALIGHDPAQAVAKVLKLKTMISDGIKPIHEKKSEVYGLLKVCGHDHETLKKVIKCVISKSPLIKSTMMEVTGKLIEGVVELTKLMAHGAMHEACLIEVVKKTEDEAIELVKKVKTCVDSNDTLKELEDFIKSNNATVIDIEKKLKAEKVDGVQSIIRKMLTDDNKPDVQDQFKNKLLKLEKELKSIDFNRLTNDTKDDGD